MKFKIYTIAIILLNSVLSLGQTPNWEWSKDAGSSSTAYGNSVCVDAAGNSYSCGIYISSSINFNGNILPNSGNDDAFIVKYSKSGNVLWARNISGSLGETAFGISVDPNCNVYVTGYFSTPTILVGTTTLSTVGNSDIFIVKYDSTGNVLWAKSAGGSNDDMPQGICVDANGNSYITGFFSAPSITFGITTLTCSINATFVVKYDVNGNVVWASKGGESSNGKSISVDANANTYITGTFSSPSSNFGGIPLTNSDVSGNTTDAFIAKYNSNGGIAWAKNGIGNNTDYGSGISVTSNGFAYVTGRFVSQSITFGSTTLNISNSCCNDIFIVKYDPLGNVVWAKREGDYYDDRNLGIYTDNVGNFYVTGFFQSFSLTLGNTTLTNADNTNNTSDIFVAKYNSSGNAVWAKSALGNLGDGAYAIAVDANGNSYITGFFYSSPLNFDTHPLTNSGVQKYFIAKLGNSCALNPITLSFSNTSISCHDSSDGSSLVNVSGGTSPYSFQWSSNSGNQTSQTALNLNAGSFVVTVVDSNGCFDIDTTEFGNPTDINITTSSISATAACSGTATVNAVGGTSPYDYIWDYNANNQTTQTAIDLCSGTYCVTITDNNGCQKDTCITVDATVNIDEDILEKSVIVYPNPTNNIFTIIVPSSTEQILISNSFGQILQQTISIDQTAYNFELDINGIYYIQISTDKNIFTKKIIVCK